MRARPRRRALRLTHPAVSCVIPGGKGEAEVRSNVELMAVQIPPQLWADLKAAGLLPRDLPMRSHTRDAL